MSLDKNIIEARIAERLKGVPVFSLFAPSTWGLPSYSTLEEKIRPSVVEQLGIELEAKKKAREEENQRIREQKEAERIANQKSPEELALDELDKSIEADRNKVAGATEELKRVTAKLNVIQLESEELAKRVSDMRNVRERLVKQYGKADDYAKRELEMEILDLEESIEDEEQNLANTRDHLNVLEGSGQALKMDIRNTKRRIRQHSSKSKQGRSLLSTREHVGNVDGYLQGISDDSNMDSINLLIEGVKGDINERLAEGHDAVKSSGNMALRLEEEASLLLAAPQPQEPEVEVINEGN